MADLPNLGEGVLRDWLRRDTLRSCLGPNATKARVALESGVKMGTGAVSVPQALRAMEIYAGRLQLADVAPAKDELKRRIVAAFDRQSDADSDFYTTGEYLYDPSTDPQAEPGDRAEHSYGIEGQVDLDALAGAILGQAPQ